MVHFMKWKQPGFPNKHQVVRAPASWLEEGTFPENGSSTLCAQLIAKRGLTPHLSAFLHG